MLKPFRFSRLPLILFGIGKLAELPALIKNYGNNVLFLTGKSSFDTSVAGRKLSENLKDKGIKLNTIHIPGEPTDSMIDLASEQFRNDLPAVVVSVGGGSAIDAGKAISAMLRTKGNIKDYLEGVGFKDHPGIKIPFIAVPTTSGTGSEATKNAVISRTGKDGFKKSIRHENLVPDVALVDPALTLTCPPEITSASGMDCFTQLTEAYLSTKSNEYTDALAYEGLKAIRSSLIPAYIDGSNIDARTGMSFAALTSGICLANAGLGVIHGFASSIGGRHNIPHGMVCGTLMAVSNEITVRRLRSRSGAAPALKKYSRLGKLFLEEEGQKDDYYVDGFIDYLKWISDELRLPGLKNAGIPEGDLEEIASFTECKNNPVTLEKDDLMEILRRRYC